MRFKEYIDGYIVSIESSDDNMGKVLTDLNFKWIRRDNFFDVSTSMSKEDLIKHLKQKKEDDIGGAYA